MPNEIYHKSNWGNANAEGFGDVYFDAAATNKLYNHSDYYENSNGTDKILRDLSNKASIVLTPTAYSDGSLNTVIPPYGFGSELVTNGDFSNGTTNWSSSNSSIEVVNGELKMYNQTSSPATTSQVISGLEVGKKYKVTATSRLEGSGGVTARVFFFGNIFAASTSVGQSVTQSIEITATATSATLSLFLYGTSSTEGYFDNISVKEIQEADFDFSRGSSATRVNEQGLIEDVQILSGNLVQNGNFEQIGSELVTNGDFDTDSDWSLPSGSSISDGSLNFDGTQTGTINVRQTITSLDLTKIYKVTFTVSNYTAGNVKVKISNDAQGTNKTANGTYTEYLSGMANKSLSFTANVDFIGSIDNISVKEVGQNWSFGTGWSIEDGKAVKTSGTGSSLVQTVPTTTIGKKYKFTFDTIVTGGVANAGLYGVTIPNFSTSGSQEHTIIATSTTGFNFYGSSSFEGSIDNISVIEITDDTDLPRIDYTSGFGSLLLEPQRRNDIPYSGDINSWAVKTNITVSSDNVISPDGTQNADKLTSTANFARIRESLSLSSSTTYTISFYVKNISALNPRISIFDTTNGVQLNSTYYGSLLSTTEWKRLEYQFTTTTAASVNIEPVRDLNNTQEMYIWGIQLEAGSYATSYIPTNGSTVTRSADVANNSGNADLFNDSEGVLYADVSSVNDGNYKFIGLSDGTATNRLGLFIGNSNNKMSVESAGSGANLGIYDKDIITENSNKIALKYKPNDCSLWVNGFELGVDTSFAAFADGTITKLSFDRGDGNNDFYGKTKELAVFKEALTDAELESLTSWVSFTEMATDLEYTLE